MCAGGAAEHTANRTQPISSIAAPGGGVVRMRLLPNLPKEVHYVVGQVRVRVFTRDTVYILYISTLHEG